MGIETHILQFTKREFPDAFIETDQVFNNEYFDKTNNSGSRKIAIVEATPFFKAKNDKFKSGMDLFNLKFKSTVEHYVSMGFTRIHLVFDNGSPSAKYDTHAERYKNVSAYPTSNTNMCRVSTFSDDDKWIKYFDRSGSPDNTDFKMPAVTDYSIISEDNWESYISNNMIVTDIIAYITHCFLVGRKFVKSKTTKRTRDCKLDHVRAGLLDNHDNPFEVDHVNYNKRIQLPDGVKIYIHLGKSYIVDGSKSTKYNTKDEFQWVVTRDSVKQSSSIMSPIVVKRMKEGELTSAIIFKNEFLKIVYKNDNRYTTRELDETYTKSNRNETFDPGCIVVDTVDGDLLPILLWAGTISTMLSEDLKIKNASKKNALKPHMLLWLRQSGKQAYKSSTQSRKSKNFTNSTTILKKDEDAIASDDVAQSKRDWKKSRSSSKTFTRDQFYDKKESVIARSDVALSFLNAKSDTRGRDGATPTHTNAIYYSGLQDYDDGMLSAMVSGLTNIAKSTKTGIYRNRLYPTGTFVDIGVLHDGLQKTHAVFSKLSSPLAAFIAILSLCNNDYIKNALPGVTSSVDNYNDSLFYVAIKRNMGQHSDLFSLKIEDVYYENAHPGVRYKIYVDTKTDDFKSYIDDVYYAKYLAEDRISNVLKNKVEKNFNSKYGSFARLVQTLESKQKSKRSASTKIRSSSHNDDDESALISHDIEESAYALKKRSAMETLKLHLSSGKFSFIDDDAISGLFARLSWYIEYIVSSIINDGIYPDPLVKYHGISMFGWESRTVETPKAKNAGEFTYDKGYKILKTNHVHDRAVVSPKSWYNTSSEFLCAGANDVDENQFLELIIDNPKSVADLNRSASTIEKNNASFEKIFGIIFENSSKDRHQNSNVDDDDVIIGDDDLSALVNGDRESSNIVSKVPSFETIFGIASTSRTKSPSISEENIDVVDVKSQRYDRKSDEVSNPVIEEKTTPDRVIAMKKKAKTIGLVLSKSKHAKSPPPPPPATIETDDEEKSKNTDRESPSRATTDEESSVPNKNKRKRESQPRNNNRSERRETKLNPTKKKKTTSSYNAKR
jgi:hypothetical protein